MTLFWKYFPDCLAVVFVGFILFGSWQYYFRKPQIVTQTVYASNSTVGATTTPSELESRSISPFLGLYGGNRETFGIVAGVSF